MKSKCSLDKCTIHSLDARVGNNLGVISSNVIAFEHPDTTNQESKGGTAK